MPPEPPGNCGDLIFSGHMILLVFTCKVGVQCTVQLSEKNNEIHNKNNNEYHLASLTRLFLIRLAFGVVFVLQILGTLSKRNHYTVDILLGVFVAHFLDEKVQEVLSSRAFTHTELHSQASQASQASFLWALIGASPLIHIFGRAVYVVRHNI